MQSAGASHIHAGSALSRFLRGLASEGRGAVAAKPLTGGDDLEVQRLLVELHAGAAVELPGGAPKLRLAVAQWAARLVYQLCQFIVVREVGEQQIAAACRVRCPEARGPDTDWSADLLLRHLPKLFQLARHLSGGDPLVGELKALAEQWPLSSVGLPGLNAGSLDSFIGHPGLRRLYADRVMAAVDLSRLGDSRLDDTLRADLGLHRELSPVLAGRLFEPAPGANPGESQVIPFTNAS
jgi:hypothetical protein